jgi:glutamate racemase
VGRLLGDDNPRGGGSLNAIARDSSAPIGIFDSGVGGLTVARRLFSLLPAEHVVYFGDVGRSPYGGRSKEIIVQFARQDVAFLREQGVKHIVCACNTVSSVALE